MAVSAGSQKCYATHVYGNDMNAGILLLCSEGIGPVQSIYNVARGVHMNDTVSPLRIPDNTLSHHLHAFGQTIGRAVSLIIVSLWAEVGVVRDMRKGEKCAGRYS